jgi:O-antigen/teichoic acid export membrane protein
VLGVEDFGIYNVVGGIVAMFSLINGSLTSATQRFLNFELGTKNIDRLKQIFSVSISIHAFLAIIVFILGESIGLWFVNTQINIALERMVAANWVYQCSLITFCINLICIPYNAAIIAHEKMNAFAYISIFDVVLKLIIVFLLQWILFDKLTGYAVLMLLSAVTVRVIYGQYCTRFQECKFVICKDKSLYKEMTNFAGWTFIGNSSSLLMEQGVNILINIFHGVTVNAARGLATQVEHAVNSFISNFMTAMNPQIIKSYASGEHSYMMKLVQKGSKFSFYLLLLLSLPVIIETETVLKLWLTFVPDYTVIFLRLALIYALLQTLSGTLITSVAATGKIKKYQIIVGGIQTLNFPLSFLFLYLKFEPQIIYIIAIISSCFCLAARIWFLRKLIGLSAKYYIRHVVLNVVSVAVLSCIIPYWVSNNMNEGLIRLFFVILISVVCTCFIIYLAGINSDERKYINMQILIYKKKLFNKQ